MTEPERIPPNASAVRYLLEHAHGASYEHFATLDAARSHAESAVIMEGDSGGQVYLACPVMHVRCDQPALEQLLTDLDRFAWGDGEIHYEVKPIGAFVAGGMGGGSVVDGVWLHEEFRVLGLQPAAEDVISGRAGSLFAGRLDPQAHDDDGETGLHRAAKDGVLEMVKGFIASGADVNVRSQSGARPIHFAAAGGHEEVLAMLIATGADVNAHDDRAWTPLVYARKYAPDPERIVAMLKAAGAHRTTTGRFDE